MSKIGRYEIEREIGRGAMGVVYLARDPRLRRRVAVKTFAVPDGLTEEQKDEFRERFLREAQAAGGLSHPAIVTVYDADEDPERGPFIAMELVSGKSLAELLEDGGPLDPDRAFDMAGVLAHALQAAHDREIVHRDLKPANILVSESDGSAKIADFGVARVAASSLTRSGTTVGSPTYMSPEQIQGREVDGRSDLFSLATVLYECLCGESPFTGDDLPQLAYAIVHETPVPISKRAPGLSPAVSSAVDAFFDRALAKDPSARFTSGAEFREALELARRSQDPGKATLAGDETVIAPAGPVESGPGSPPPPPRLGGRAQLAAVLAAVVALLAWWYWDASGGAYLRIKGESSVRSGSLTVTVDGKRVYSRELAAKQHKAVSLFKKVVGQGAEDFDAWIEVTPGRHEIVAYVVSEEKPTGYQDAVTVNVARGQTRKLRLSAGSSFGAHVSLRAP